MLPYLWDQPYWPLSSKVEPWEITFLIDLLFFFCIFYIQEKYRSYTFPFKNIKTRVCIRVRFNHKIGGKQF